MKLPQDLKYILEFATLQCSRHYQFSRFYELSESPISEKTLWLPVYYVSLITVHSALNLTSVLYNYTFIQVSNCT